MFEIIFGLINLLIIIFAFLYGYYIGKSRGIRWTSDVYKRSNRYDDYVHGLLLKYCIRIQNIRLCAFLNKKPEKEEIEELKKQEDSEYERYTKEIKKIIEKQ